MGPSASRRPGPTTCCRHLAGSSYARKRQGGVLSFDTHAIIRSMRQGNCKGNKRSSRSILGSAAACHRTLGCFSVRSPFSPRHFPASFPLFHSIPTYSKGMPHGRSQTSRYKNRKITKRTHFENDAVLVNQRVTNIPALRSRKNEPILLVLAPSRNRTDAGPKPSARYRQHVAPERRVALGFPPVTPQRPRRSGTSTIVANRAESCLVVAQKYFFRSLTS
jgi:hypothetical protein